MITALDTLPHAAERNLHASKAQRAFNYKLDGAWRHMSAQDFLHLAQSFALGLHSIGIQRGDTIGIIARSSPYWLIADLGIMMSGCISVPMFDNISDENLSFEIDDGGIRRLFVEGEDSLKRAIVFKNRLQSIIVRDAPFQEDEKLTAFEEVVEQGDRMAANSPQILQELFEKLRGDDIATIIYTSGSTGQPKGVELTHGNLLSQINAAGERFPLNSQSDRALSCLPLAHVFERMVIYYYVTSSVDIHFVDDIKQVGAFLRQVKPTSMTMVPRLLEKLYAKLREKVDASPWPRRAIARWAIGRALKRRTRDPKTWLDKLADRLVYRKFRRGLGGNFHRIIVGGAALAPRLHRFFINIGLPVYVGYGLTEGSPVLAANFDGHNKIGTVGPAFPGVELRVSQQGEILARGPNIMRGYHKQDKATLAVIDDEGWLHTGDLGHLDQDGYLVIDGRAKDLLKTSNGKYVSPLPIEQTLCECPFIDMAMIIAEGKPYVTCLLFLDKDNLNGSAKGLKRTDESGAARLPDSLRFGIQKRIDKLNRNLNHWERIRDFRCFLETPSIEKEEMTPTMKLRRHVIEEAKHTTINAMYSSHASIMAGDSIL